MKREVPYIIMLVMVVLRWGFEFIAPLDALTLADGQGVRTLISYCMSYMEIMALFLGILNFSRVHLANIKRRKEYWILSGWAIFAAWSFGLLGIIKGQSNSLYSSIYNCMYTPPAATTYSLLAFFIASAAYRAFRIRNLESILMMVCALVVMLANVPIGDLIWPTTSWLGGFIGVKDWAMGTPTAAATRAIAIGTFLGSVASRWRVTLGIERRHLPMD